MENPINMPDMQFIYDIMDEEIKKLDPSAVLEDEAMEPLDLPQGFEDQGAMAPPPPMPVEEVPTIEQEPQVQPVSPVPPPPTPQNRPQPRSVDPIGGLQSPSAGRDERADALFE